MMKLAIAAACVWFAGCSGRGEGDPPQLPPMLGGPEPGQVGGQPSATGSVPVPGTTGPDDPAPSGVAAENLAPELVSLEAEQSAVEANGSTALTVRVRDAEDDPVHVWWDSSCGIVAATSGGGRRAVFLAPGEPGPCTVTVQVQDHELQRSREYAYQLQVLPAAGSEMVDDLR